MKKLPDYMGALRVLYSYNGIISLKRQGAVAFSADRSKAPKTA